jgi:hypothetical protein
MSGDTYAPTPEKNHKQLNEFDNHHEQTEGTDFKGSGCDLLHGTMPGETRYHT